jgi:hypothetical protein
MKRNGAGRSSFLFGQQAEVRYQMLVSQAELLQARSGMVSRQSFFRQGQESELTVAAALPHPLR